MVIPPESETLRRALARLSLMLIALTLLTPRTCLSQGYPRPIWRAQLTQPPAQGQFDLRPLDGRQIDEGPNSSIMQLGTLEKLPPPLTIQNGSPIRPIPILPRQIRLRDIVSIRVEELARMQSEGEVERRKNASINATLLRWITLNGFRSAESHETDKRIQGQLDELYRAENGIEKTERLTFNIAAEVVDIRPNGTIVLEARKEIHTNGEVWKAALTGICRQEDIGQDNVILSRNIVDLRIAKDETGHVADATRRGWLLKLYDLLHPF